MLLLAIESTGPGCSVALCDLAHSAHDAPLGQHRLDARRGQADRLIGLVDGLLGECAVGYRDLGLIAVDVGPGSFTGLRTGVAAARGLALATGLQVCPVTSLESLAESDARPAGKAVLAALDARRGEVYAQAFDPGLAPLGPPVATSPDRALGWLPPPVHVVGSGAPLVREADPARVQVVPNELDALAVARCALRRLAAGRRPVAGWDVRPLYLRAPDAKPQLPAARAPAAPAGA